MGSGPLVGYKYACYYCSREPRASEQGVTKKLKENMCDYIYNHPKDNGEVECEKRDLVYNESDGAHWVDDC